MTKSGIQDFGRWITFDRNICNLALCYVAPLWQQQFCRLLLFFSHWKLRVGHVISFASSLANVRPQRRRACVSLTHLPSAEQLHTSQQQSSSSIAFSDLLREIPPRATVRRKKSVSSAIAVQLSYISKMLLSGRVIIAISDNLLGSKEARTEWIFGAKRGKRSWFQLLLHLMFDVLSLPTKVETS